MTSHFRPIDVTGMKSGTMSSQAAPQLQWVKIADLVIDERYQRPLAETNRRAIQAIAAAFNWSRFSPVIVAPVEGGRYAIVDGQHRCHAAALCGIEAVPAMVALIAPEEQALAFVDINTRQIKVHRLNVYRAALAAGEPWALAASAAVAAAGCQLMTSARSTKDKKPGQVFCVGAIRGLVDRGDAAAVTAGLKAMLEFDPASVANFSEVLLVPWLTAVANTTVDHDVLVAALRSHRPWLVIETAKRLAKADGVPVARAARDGLSGLIKRAALNCNKTMVR